MHSEPTIRQNKMEKSVKVAIRKICVRFSLLLKLRSVKFHKPKKAKHNKHSAQ